MPLNLSRNQIIIVSAIFSVVCFLCWFLGVIPGLKEQNSGGFWPRRTDCSFFLGRGKQRFSYAIFENYQKIRPNVRVDYKQINENDYEKTLINALAAGRFDIMMFRGNWLPKHADKIIPANENQITFSRFRNYSRQWLFPILLRKKNLRFAAFYRYFNFSLQ